MSDDMSSLGQEPSMLCEKFALLWFNTAMQPRKKVNLVEVYVMVYVALLLILLVLGHYRRRSRNLVVQYGFKGAYLLSWVLVSKTLGRMLGVIKNELYPVWATFMVLVFAGANSVLVQNLDENKQWLKFMFDSALYLNYFNAIVENLATIPGTKVYIPVIVLFFVGVLFCIKYRERQHALALASEARGNGSRTVARHMKHETVLSRRYDPHTMQGYNYLVLPFINLNLPIRLLPGQVYAKPVRDRLVTLEKIWCHDSGVLSSDDDPAIRHLKDMCLSFALFRLAVRRYFGYACAESGLSKTRDLVLQGLLPRAEEDWERAFQVIEVELAFLYDFFFAMYARIMCREIRSVVVSLVATTFIIGIGTYSLTHLTGGGSFEEFGLVETESQDIVVTIVILCALVVIQLLQVGMYWVSDWAKVSLICKYITKPSWQGNTCIEGLLLSMGKLSFFLERHKWCRRWENRLGQYSLLDAFNYPGHVLEKCSIRIPMFREGRKARKSIPVPMEVKKALARTLKDSNGHISNGTPALCRHGLTELHWACQTDEEFTLAHLILTWHLATTYCEISEVNMNIVMLPADHHVATSLSKYCAYLVAFAPELVPGNSLDTEYMLDELVWEARKAFPANSDIYKRLGELHREGTKDGMLAKGTEFGMKLESMENQWKVLADFWAELLLYIAPSDNVANHIEHLAKGGEFVTHVWALLMHAGILERPAASAAEGFV